jgi:hypothetical protein
MLELNPAAYAHLSRLLDEGVFAWAIAIEASPGSAFYVTNNPEDIDFAGHTWQSFPLELGIQNKDGEGDLTTTTLSLTNIGKLVMDYLESRAWDQGRVNVRLVYVPAPDELPVGLDLDYRIQGAAATFTTITLNLGQPNFFGRQYPAKRFVRDAGYPGIPRNVG